jgi:hypothetical protein
VAGTANVSPVRDAMMAETLACRFASEAADVHEIFRVELETECALSREALATNTRDLALEGVLFKGIWELLADQFRCDCVRNIPRSCNLVAHEIARLDMSRGPGQSMVWLDPLLEFLNILVAHDLAEQSVCLRKCLV